MVLQSLLLKQYKKKFLTQVWESKKHAVSGRQQNDLLVHFGITWQAGYFMPNFSRTTEKNAAPYQSH